MKNKVCECCGNEYKVSGTYQKYCKDCSNASGIYKIINKQNGKIYIGQSVNIIKRLNAHKNTLKENKHNNIHLQNSYNKYGKDSFEYIIIEKCDENKLTERELYWINYYQSHDNELGYNIFQPDENIEKFRHSDETKIKLSQAKIIYSKEELISYLQEYYYHYGKVPTTREIDDLHNFPTSGTYAYAFGNFKNSLIEADLYDLVESKAIFDRHEYTKEEILEMYSKFIEKHGRMPVAKEHKKASYYNLPTYNIVIKLFGSIDNLKKELNYKSNEELKQEEKDEAIKLLRELFLKEGYLTSRTIDKSPVTRSTKFYSTNFGSLMNAYKLAGIYTKEYVTKKLLEFYNMYKRFPTKNDYENFKLPPMKIVSEYYNKEELERLFGIDKEAIKEKENTIALSLLKQLYEEQGYVDQDTINASKLTKSVKFYRSRFGSLKNACLKANVPLDKLILKYG